MECPHAERAARCGDDGEGRASVAAPSMARAHVHLVEAEALGRVVLGHERGQDVEIGGVGIPQRHAHRAMDAGQE
jgi:hypothetical protein